MKSQPLPGMAEAVVERLEAEQQAILAALNEVLRQPLGSISDKAGRMERESPIFHGTGENPSLF
jgi:hypothetical protein